MTGQTGPDGLVHEAHTHLAADSLPTRPSRSWSLVPSSTPWSSAVLTIQSIHPALCVWSGGTAFQNMSAARGGLSVFPGSVLDGARWKGTNTQPSSRRKQKICEKRGSLKSYYGHSSCLAIVLSNDCRLRPTMQAHGVHQHCPYLQIWDQEDLNRVKSCLLESSCTLSSTNLLTESNINQQSDFQESPVWLRSQNPILKVNRRIQRSMFHRKSMKPHSGVLLTFESVI